MQFDQYLNQAREGGAQQIAASWGQGRTTFGGLSAAITLESISSIEAKAENGGKRLLRSLNVNFCGPLMVEQPFELEHQLLSEGKSISQRTGQAIQNGRVVTQVVACYGASRDSDIAVQAERISLIEQGVVGPGQGTKLGYIAGVTAEFVQHIDFSLIKGGFPFSDCQETVMEGWMRFSSAPDEFHDSHLAALIDSWPPVVMQMMKRPGPASSVSWNLELMQPLPKIEPEEWLFYQAVIKQAANGYAHTDSRVYKADGTLLALSRQLVTIYDKKQIK
ncbi:acyl-CoA thioesterase [Pelagibaculum spongiae]|uniref:Thioesterase family protein n=1 Tax=Pelagibaculum spongiae TaxID=2080658 RepID=A0A2V1GWI4_9GAMM|nr:thioesterase family protein [Pelagibaculum spongiae]PVZ65450.1 thioesterase family protein [Pelagibaculum spongiae]